MLLVDNGLPTKNQTVPVGVLPKKKLTYPLKDDGWKTIVLLKWSLFRVNIPLAFQRGNLGASPQQLAWLQDLQLCATCPVFFAARTCVVGYQNGYKDG